MPKPITTNTLLYDDYLSILREHVADESVDLIYLDPPFNSNRGATSCDARHEGRMKTRTIRFIFGATIGLSALLLLVSHVPVSSAPLVTHSVVPVTTATDEYDTSGTGTGCSLREAIKTANDNTGFSGCTVVPTIGPPPAVILLPSNTHTLTIPGSSEDLDATGDLDIRGSMVISATSALTPTVDATGLNDRAIAQGRAKVHFIEEAGAPAYQKGS